MDDLIIEPGKGIGLIKLGMSKDEVEKCIQKYTEKYQKEYHIQDYFKGFFMVEYDSEGKVYFATQKCRVWRPIYAEHCQHQYKRI